jgi:hypothetical protein
MANNSEEGQGSQRAVMPVMMMMMMMMMMMIIQLYKLVLLHLTPDFPTTFSLSEFRTKN